MKYYILRETAGYPTIIRNGQKTLLSLGDQFDEKELATLACDSSVVYLCTSDNSIVARKPGTKATKPAPVVEETPPATETPETPPAAE